MKYNSKIDMNGKYLPFYGWSVIFNVNNDLKMLENYIKNHSLLKRYFSALPSSSYHMTLYNIWCNKKKLLPYQKKFINQHYEKNKQVELINQSRKIGKFNPDNCINGLLYRINDCLYEENWDETIDLEVYKVVYTGSTLQITLKENTKFIKINKYHDKISELCGMKGITNLGYYHITLGYQYKNFENKDIEKKINYEVFILNILLENQKISINRPFTCYFEDMTQFKEFENRRCHGYLVPDYETQQKLGNLGFCMKAPMSSFKKNPSKKESKTEFGGPHISVLRRRNYSYECHKQLKYMAEQMNGWSLPPIKLQNYQYQSTIVLQYCSKLSESANNTHNKGWPSVSVEHYHLSIYSKNLYTNPTNEQLNQIVKHIKKAKWGFILSIDNGDDMKFKFNWSTFLPI